MLVERGELEADERDLSLERLEHVAEVLTEHDHFFIRNDVAGFGHVRRFSFGRNANPETV